MQAKNDEFFDEFRWVFWTMDYNQTGRETTRNAIILLQNLTSWIKSNYKAEYILWHENLASQPLEMQTISISTYLE